MNLNGRYRTSMWCRGRDSNPHRNSHYHLKIACLPIPPPRREKRYMQNRGGWQAFFCDSVKFFRLSAWGPGLFPCAGVTDGSSGEELHSLLWKGRRNLFVSAAEVFFWGPRNPALGKAALIRTLEEGGSGGKTRFSFNLSKRVALPGCCMSMQGESAEQGWWA